VRRPADRKVRSAAPRVQTAARADQAAARPAATARRTAARKGNKLENRGSNTNMIQRLAKGLKANRQLEELARCKQAGQLEPRPQADSTRKGPDSTPVDSRPVDSSTADSSTGIAERL
jgi:hypothetical protein